LRLSAALGALKLTVAAVCAIHIADRIRSMASGAPANEILETGLLIAIAITLVSIAPAIWSQNADLTRGLLIQFLLAALAVVLCIIERPDREPNEQDKARMALDAAIAAHKAATGPPVQRRWFTPWRR
jgi:hypothetical protein